MQVLFLGTAAAEGYPAIFCECKNCVESRVLGGRNLRKRSAVLINQDLLIDFGPDIVAAMHACGLNLAHVRYLLVTHSHADHYLFTNFYYRSPGFCPTNPLLLDVYATDPLITDLHMHGGEGVDIEEKWRVRLNCIKPFETRAAGPYRVTAFPAVHDPKTQPVFYAIAWEGKSLLYACDTGPFTAETWEALRRFRFDVAIIESTLGIGPGGTHHLSMEQCAEHHRRLADEGLLQPHARRIATHFSHQRTPPYLGCVDFFQPHGVEVAYDGMVVSV